MASFTKPHISVKHMIIDRANTQILISVSIAVFIVIFCVFAFRALYSQSQYYGRVIKEKETALEQLEDNNKAVKDLQSEYVSFATEVINVLGGNPEGSGPLDGDNALLVLDALPSDYDFPAVGSSIEKILIEGGYKIKSVGGEEEDIDPNNGGDKEKTVVKTTLQTPTEIPFPFKIEASPESLKTLLKTFETSIRPFGVSQLKLKGQDGSLEVEIGISTYYQLESGFQITSKEVN